MILKRIFNWVENSLDVSEEIGLNSDQFKLLLNLDDFATEKILKNEDKLNHTPKSIKENILNFILSKKPSDLDLEGEGYDSLKSWEIANGDYNSEVHHIIPLTQGKETIKQSTKEIRTDKSHYLNSILNLTIIREESNRYIGGLKPSEYLSEIVVQKVRCH